MKRVKIIAIITIIIACSLLFTINELTAQQKSTTESDPDIENEGEIIADIIISKFEDAESWVAQMPIDQGQILLMKRYGKPNGLPEVDPNTQIPNKSVLGLKILFNKRGLNRFTIEPPRPIKIPGITKQIQVWVAGRNFSHALYVWIKDFFNTSKMLKLGTLNHLGWKRMVLNLPPTLAQDEFHYSDVEGITFMGLVVETMPVESYGTFYIYFDELIARTNVFNMSIQEADDMVDNW